MTTRPADELAAGPEPAWPLVREWVDAARVPVRELHAFYDDAAAQLGAGPGT